MNIEKNTAVAVKQQSGLAIPPAELAVARKLDQVVQWANENIQLAGFERTYSLAYTIGELASILTPEYMKPIMKLQNTKLGFKTDAKEGYSEAIVKSCLIEATLNGVQVVGNQFNIIKGNMYITKEGYAYLLNNFNGLAYQIIPSLPRMNAGNTSAAVDMRIIWSVNESKQKEVTLPVPIKMDAYATTDQVLGKAMRKARAWLYATITGRELPDADAENDIAAFGTKPEGKPISEMISSEDTKFVDVKQMEGAVEATATDPPNTKAVTGAGSVVDNNPDLFKTVK